MGCGTGACGISSAPRRMNVAARTTKGACCSDCARDDRAAYRAQMQNAFSPYRNAGKILYDEGTLVTGPGYVAPPTSGTLSGSGGSSLTDAQSGAIAGGVSSALQEIGATARAQINADLERERIRATADVARANREAGYASDGTMPQYRDTASDSGVATSTNNNNGLLLLVAAGVAAAMLSGVGKKLLK